MLVREINGFSPSPHSLGAFPLSSLSTSWTKNWQENISKPRLVDGIKDWSTAQWTTVEWVSSTSQFVDTIHPYRTIYTWNYFQHSQKSGMRTKIRPTKPPAQCLQYSWNSFRDSSSSCYLYFKNPGNCFDPPGNNAGSRMTSSINFIT